MGRGKRKTLLMALLSKNMESQCAERNRKVGGDAVHRIRVRVTFVSLRLV